MRIFKFITGPFSGFKDNKAVHIDIENEFENIPLKPTVNDTDLVILEDSTDNFNKKKVQAIELTGGGGGGVDLFTIKVTGTDTTPEFLDAKLTVSKGTNITNPLEKSVINPGAVESLDIQFDESKVDHNNLNNASLANTGITYGHIDDQPQDIYGTKTFKNDIVVENNISAVKTVYDIANLLSPNEGEINWNSEDGTLQIGLPGGNVKLQVGQENLLKAKATENILNGQAVFISGATGNNPEVSLGSYSTLNTAVIIGLATEDINLNNFGYVTVFGLVRDINTISFTEGDTLWLADNGAITNTRPDAPLFNVVVGVCLRSHLTEGIVFCKIDIVPRLQGLSDVYLPSVADGDTIYWNGSNSRFEASKVFNQALSINGFLDPVNEVNISFDNATRTFTISPQGVSYTFYVTGVPYTKTALETIVIDDLEGFHYIYYDNTGFLQISNNLLEEVITKYAFVAAIYWDSTNKKQVYIASEYRHTTQMEPRTHIYLHTTRGFSLESGGVLENILVDATGALDEHVQFSNVASVAWDEDARADLGARLATSILPVFYREGLDTENKWRIDESNSFPVLTAGTGRAAFNNLNLNTWEQAEIANNDFVLAHVALTNDALRPYVVFQGQTDYPTIIQAREGAYIEINNLILTGLPFLEFKFVATIIIQTSNGYTNTVKSRIRSTDTGEDYVDLRKEKFYRE